MTALQSATSAGSSVLQAKNVTIQYHAPDKITVAAYKINFQLNQGERLTIVGQSGCGKSTLLNAVAGFLKIADGSLQIKGRTITQPEPDRVVVFQEHGLLPWKTAIENVMFPLQHAQKMSTDDAAKKAQEVLTTVGLGALGSKYPHALSGGQRQRVAIARALAMRPEVLLMDEPFSALDQITKGNLQDELIRLCDATQATVLFITHDIREAIKVGHRILVLSSQPGQVIAELVSRHDDGAQAIEDQKNQIEQLLGVH
jgi:NitT/TauT family transport system ATP-binding protein